MTPSSSYRHHDLMMPTSFDFSDFSGITAEAEQVESHLATVAAMVRAYTRGAGFDDGEPADDLARVIVSSATRLVSNPTHQVSAAIDDYTVRPGVFTGWTLPELAVLNRYRVRAL